MFSDTVSDASYVSTRAPSPHSRSADEEAILECIEAIEAIKEANNKKKEWWIDGNYKAIDEERLPLRLMKNVTYREYEKVKLQMQADVGSLLMALSSYMSCQNMIIEIVRFLGNFYLPSIIYNSKMILRVLERQGNPWPTVVCEDARSHILQKTNSFWLAPNRSEDVIILKLWEWNPRRDTNGRPLRRLTCYKFCRCASLQAGQAQGRFQPVQTYEFGTIDRYQRPYNGCSAQGMLTVTIAPECVYEGCTPPYPPYPLAGNHYNK
ncbi:6748_t:CDS:2 [Paraglomus occultum]|uniref:6748_t:CDS:1 n=1 Tax=Paraglomus occultum TaxID=144539 RepID=A0A9N9A206_9GLOM|nr:6748_t:CDS:2 [Paraglomus occultum]